MKKFLLSTVALVALGASASAADLAPRYTKAPTMVDPAYNWTGFYVGLHVGAASSDGSLTTQDTDNLSFNDQSPIRSAKLDLSLAGRLATTISLACRCLASKPMPLR